MNTALKLVFKNLLKALNLEVRRDSKYNNAFKMQSWLMRHVTPKTIMDIGAYDGSVAFHYHCLFPNAMVYCFEPFPESFRKLQTKVKGHEHLFAINKAVGEKNGSMEFQVNQYDQTNSILKTHQMGSAVWGEGLLETVRTIPVESMTLDAFTKSEDIDEVDILKIDVQGAEQYVIKGAQSLFKRKKVQLVYMEIITMPTYEGQLPFDEVLKLMRSYDFVLINLYNPSMTEAGRLRQVDAIFLNAGHPDINI